MPLVTSLDGTQTFGWTDGAAMFSTQPPTITMPPFTELEFPLYLKPKSEAYADVAQAVVRSLRQPSTPLNSAFFSRANVDALHQAIQARISESMGLGIDRQSDWELLLVMRRTYLETANNWPDDVPAEVARLNSMALQEAVAAVARNITRYMTFRANLAQPVPLPSPAEQLTAQPYLTGSPAPLPDLNAEYELGLRGVMATRQPQTRAPVPMPTNPASPGPGPTAEPLWETTPPRETQGPV